MPLIGAGGSIVSSANIVDGTIVNADVSASAAIAASKLSGLPYGLLDYQSLSSPAATITSATFTAKKFIRVIARVTSLASTGILQIRFNGDSGSNYNDSRAEQQAAATSDALDTRWNLETVNATGDRLVILDIYNVATLSKKGHGITNKGQQIAESVGEWVNTTDAITSITLLNNGGGNLGAGSEMTILGMD